jgi:hypothetical protein
MVVLQVFLRVKMPKEQLYHRMTKPKARHRRQLASKKKRLQPQE